MGLVCIFFVNITSRAFLKSELASLVIVNGLAPPVAADCDCVVARRFSSPLPVGFAATSVAKFGI